mgnify:CR=1 FL=1
MLKVLYYACMLLEYTRKSFYPAPSILKAHNPEKWHIYAEWACSLICTGKKFMDTAITWWVCNALFAREKMVWAPEMRHYTEGPIGQQHQFPVCVLPAILSALLRWMSSTTAKMSKASSGDHFLHTCLTSILVLRTPKNLLLVLLHSLAYRPWFP